MHCFEISATCLQYDIVTIERHREQRIETAKIKKTTTAQAEIQRRHRAQKIETAKIKTSTTQGRDHSAACKTM